MEGLDRCPICNAPVKPRAENSAFPFCTARCKTIDLGKWLNEEYRVPVEHDELEDEDGVASESSAEEASKTSRDMRH